MNEHARSAIVDNTRRRDERIWNTVCNLKESYRTVMRKDIDNINIYDAKGSPTILASSPRARST
jgi:hypothetical protein